MKLTVQVKLLPDAEQAEALAATLACANRAANFVAEIAWERKVFRNYALRRHTYAQVKALGLSAQPAQHVIKKVADAYRTLTAQVRDGVPRPLPQPVSFRADAAQPYDDRCLSWQIEQRTVSIWTAARRLRGVRFLCGVHQA